MIEKQASGLNPQLHIRDTMSNGLILANSFSELASCPGIGYDLLKLALHHSHIGRKQAGTLPLHRSFKDLGPLPLSANSIARWYPTRVQMELAGRRTAQSHFVKWRTQLQSGCSLFDN